MKTKIETKKAFYLDNRQLRKYNQLDGAHKEKYLLSFAGYQQRLGKLFLTQNIKTSSQTLDPILNREKSHIYKMLRQLYRNGASIIHTPPTISLKSQWVGIEIECLFEGEAPSNTVTCERCDGSGRDENGSTCDACNGDGCIDGEDEVEPEIMDELREELCAAKVPRVSVKQDGSLSKDGHVGVEITLLFDMARGFGPLKKVCEILNAKGAVINNTCGLHVHLDVRALKRDAQNEIEHKLYQCLPILSLLVPKSRRDNTYCKQLPNDDDDRYCAINRTAIARHGTIEVRLHSGTTCFEKIFHWLTLLQEIKHAPVAKTKIKSLQSLIEHLQLEGELLKYLDQRFQKFNIETNEHKTDFTLDDETAGADDTASVAPHLVPVQIPLSATAIIPAGTYLRIGA